MCQVVSNDKDDDDDDNEEKEKYCTLCNLSCLIITRILLGRCYYLCPIYRLGNKHSTNEVTRIAL